MMDLLDAYMPEYDRRVRHTTDVRANAMTVAASILRANLGGSELIRVLLERSCGATLLAALDGTSGRLTLEAFQALGCVLVTGAGGYEVALGAIGGVSAASRFTLQRTDAGSFRSTLAPTGAKVLWHFSVFPAGLARSMLTLETRLRAGDGEAGRRWLTRWDALDRLSARARRDVLLAMKAEAEFERSAHRCHVIWD